MTDKQKQTISTLKKAYEQINSETNCVGVFLDINTILSEHQKGKSMIDEIILHNEAIKSTYRDTLEDFKNKAQGDFQKLGWNLYFKKGSRFLYFSNQHSTSNLGYFQIESKLFPTERINEEFFQRIHSPIYKVWFSYGVVSYGSYKGFEALLNRDEVKETILKVYNRDKR